MENINIWAALVAAVSSFLLGGLWYSPALFLKAWTRESGQSQSPNPQAGHPVKVFALSFLFALISAFVFAYWIGPEPSLDVALKQGLMAGAGFVAASFGINYQFANRSILLWFIDGGYHIVQFLLFGLILGLWH